MISNEMNLNQNLKQKQVLSPIQYLQMEVLTFSNSQLLDYLEKKEEENPLIEVEKSNISYSSSINFKNKKNYTSNDFSSNNIEDEDNQFENYISDGKSLKEKLKDDISVISGGADEIQVANDLIYYIDKNGLIKESIDELSKLLERSFYEIENGLILLKSINSNGLGARTFKELIYIQVHLRTDNDFYSIFLNDYWDDIINQRWNNITAKFKNINEVQRIIDRLRKIIDLDILNEYITSSPHYIVPDVIVYNKDDELNIEINNLFNFRKTNISTKDLTKELKKKYDEANIINFAIQKREENIRKFVEYLVLFQQDFFNKGPEYIKPITQKEFANRIGVSVSTVSRIVSEKFLQTDFGIYPFKVFFQSVRNTRDSQSKEYLKDNIVNEIKKLIDSEDPKNTLSDQKIVELLKNRNYNIARRTVAKYRKKLGIPPARKRLIK